MHIVKFVVDNRDLCICPMCELYTLKMRDLRPYLRRGLEICDNLKINLFLIQKVMDISSAIIQDARRPPSLFDAAAKVVKDCVYSTPNRQWNALKELEIPKFLLEPVFMTEDTPLGENAPTNLRHLCQVCS